MPSGKDRLVAALMPLLRRDVAQAAVPMLMVVPANKAKDPVSSLMDVSKAIRRHAA